MEECGGGGDEVLTGGRVSGSVSARPGLSHWPRHDPPCYQSKVELDDGLLSSFFNSI